MTSGIAQSLKAEYVAGSERLRLEFEQTRSGRSVHQGRTALVDSLAHQLWRHHINPDLSSPAGLPWSPSAAMDEVFSLPTRMWICCFCLTEKRLRRRTRMHIRAMCQDLWDLRLKVESHHSHVGRLRSPPSRQPRVQYFAARLPPTCR